MDKVYLSNDINILFLDCTRINGNDELTSRLNPDDKDSVERQIKDIACYFLKNKQRKIVLADDVVFSGTVLRKITNIFKKYGIEVVGVCSSIATINSYNYFNENLKYGLKTEYVLSNSVIDQICERDFYFGIPQSGISIIGSDNIVYKSPYFKPYGNPIERSSIPYEYELYFSKGCLNRSIVLWEEIERLSNKEVLIRDLPERIINTNVNDRVVKVLRKEEQKI